VFDRKLAVFAGIFDRMFRWFGLCQSLPLFSGAILAFPSSHPKIPFLAAGVFDGQLRFVGPGILEGRDATAAFRACPWLVRIQAEDFKLPAPLRGGIAKSLDSDTPRQTTFDRRLDKIGREERERDRHIDLTTLHF
jgi:hypothetical protein